MRTSGGASDGDITSSSGLWPAFSASASPSEDASPASRSASPAALPPPPPPLTPSASPPAPAEGAAAPFSAPCSSASAIRLFLRRASSVVRLRSASSASSRAPCRSLAFFVSWATSPSSLAFCSRSARASAITLWAWASCNATLTRSYFSAMSSSVRFFDSCSSRAPLAATASASSRRSEVASADTLVISSRALFVDALASASSAVSWPTDAVVAAALCAASLDSRACAVCISFSWAWSASRCCVTAAALCCSWAVCCRSRSRSPVTVATDASSSRTRRPSWCTCPAARACASSSLRLVSSSCSSSVVLAFSVSV
mmetsp:Transcript_4687/g.12002  ORF Transcript_4687/g.12002 Transcript_4687/m.12002 type:complete len:315 (+) Transcript_4687:871-1815(+)